MQRTLMLFGRYLRPPIRWMTESFRALPVVSRIGVPVLGAGFVTDVGYHLATGQTSPAVPCCGPGFVGHVVTLAGMVMVIVGILQMAFRPQSRQAPGGRSS